MSYIAKIQKITAAVNPKLEDTVNKMMADKGFNRAIDPLISAAESGIQVGHLHQKPDMVKFNALSLAYFKAIKHKDAGAALNAADALCKAGHGKAFGLQ